MDRLKNKVAIVTGAAGGIGKAIAIRFAEEGAKVLATDLQKEKLEEWTDKEYDNGVAISTMYHDVTLRASWDQVIEKALSLYGRVDILINNAGIYPLGLNISNTTDDIWNKTLAVNLTSAFIGTQLCVPIMKENGGGAIVNISSIAGLVGGNGAVYSASKAGVTLFTKDNAVEMASANIRVNSIHPGGVDTPMTEFMKTVENHDELVANMCPMKRMGKPEEIANGVLFLASDESSYITGAELVIDGGMTAR